MCANKVIDRKPIKAEMGKWNFQNSEFRDGKTMWLVECECRRVVQWMSPSAFKKSKQCFPCAIDTRKETYKIGKEQIGQNKSEEWDDKDFLQFEAEKVAPIGQLSLDKPQPIAQQPTHLENDENRLLYQLEYSLKLASETAHRLKEMQLKRSVK